MGEHQPVQEIRAAGAVLWRPGAGGTEVALIHRPKYDDWSFPKGKLLPGEHVLLGAVREVTEETGIAVTLGRGLSAVRYLVSGAPKRVDYWAAEAGAGAPEFTANSEVDELAWLPVAAARQRLSYDHDVAVLEEFRAGPLQTVPFVLLRHASAGSKSDWPGSDESRPLDAGGARDAAALASLLRCFGVFRLVSSPAERCLATLRPYAAMTGGEVEAVQALCVGADDRITGKRAAAVAAVVTRLLAAGPAVVICGHRENLPVMLETASAELAADVPPGHPLHKGEFLVLHRADGRVAAAERYRPEPLLPPRRRKQMKTARPAATSPAPMPSAAG